jgi:hypothetical protein
MKVFLKEEFHATRTFRYGDYKFTASNPVIEIDDLDTVADIITNKSGLCDVSETDYVILVEHLDSKSSEHQSEDAEDSEAEGDG